MTNLVEDQVKMSLLVREFLDNIGAEVRIGGISFALIKIPVSEHDKV